ncbi:hypothetical protein BDB01DRAFT_776107 [Pilobolus umbonatus]|nr:hypothetical protein BDB01DRAFT_776107 [Pilobolus umbonatus]
MSHDNYELPSIYTRKPETDLESDNDEEVALNVNMSTPPPRSNYRDIHIQDSRTAWLLLLTAFFILLLTTVPAVADLPDINVWFTGDALWRLFDPIITLPLSLFVMTRADIMDQGGRPNYWISLSERSVGWLVWSIGAGIYVQGHGIHTAAALFKHPIQDFNRAHPELVVQYPVLEQMYSNMRDLWEHDIAHYMYAGGAMVMSWAQLFVFRNQVHGPLPTSTKIVWCLGILVYGLLLAAVAIDFPYGLVVGLIYAGGLSVVCISMMLFNTRYLPRGGLFTMGRRMVIQYYLMACVIALVIIIVWICIYGLKTRKAAGF